MSYEEKLRIIRRGTYRTKVIQAGGKFIEVIDGNEVDLREQLDRKAEYDKIMYDREMGYMGFDEHNYPEREEVDLT